MSSSSSSSSRGGKSATKGSYFAECRAHFERLRKSYGLQHKTNPKIERPESYQLWQSHSPDPTIADKTVPVAPFIRICDRQRLLNASAARNNCAAVFGYMHELSANGFVPGLCGGGVTSVELPMTAVNPETFSEFAKMLRECMEEQVQLRVFRNEQKHALDLGGVNEDESKAYPRERFCGMPETGGVAKVTLAVRHIGAYKFLVVSVDSYWYPAQIAFERTLAKLERVLQSDDNELIERNKGLIDAMVASFTARAEKLDERDAFCDAKSKTSSEVNRLGGVPIEHCFRCAGFEYMNAMSAFHRICLITEIVAAVRDHVRIGMSQASVIDAASRARGSNSRVRLAVPSLCEEASDAAGRYGLFGGLPLYVRVIHPVYLRSAVHSSVHVMRRESADYDGVYVSCRRYALKDVASGDAHINYGDVGQGILYSGRSAEHTSITTPAGLSFGGGGGSHYSGNTDSSSVILYARQFTPPLHTMTSWYDAALADLVVPVWKSVAPNVTLGGAEFYTDRMSHNSMLVSLVVPMQEYYEMFWPHVPVYVVKNAAELVPACQKFLSKMCTPSVVLGNAVTPECIITLLAAAPIECMPFREVVEKARKSGTQNVVVSPNHLSQFISQRLPSDLTSPINSAEHVKRYGDTREYYCISLAHAEKILEKMPDSYD